MRMEQPDYCRIEQLEELFVKFDGTHLYTWVGRGIVRIKCLAQEHSIMSPARGRVRISRSEDECTNHEDIASPTLFCRILNARFVPGASGPGSSPGRGNWRCCVLGQDTQLSQCLSPPRSINWYRRIVGET